MTPSEALWQQAYDKGITVLEDPFLPVPFRGLYLVMENQPFIVLHPQLTTCQKTYVLAEEMAHHQTAFTDARYSTKWQMQKQERLAQQQCVRMLVPFECLKRAVQSGARTLYDLSNALDVPEDFVPKVCSYYRQKCPEQFSTLKAEQCNDP